MLKVAFLGPMGTYSHQAAIQQFPANTAEYMPVGSIPECFNKLKSDLTIDFAVVPLENSTNGQVVFTYDLLRDWMLGAQNFEGNEVLVELEIVAEQYVSIELCLIAPVVTNLNELSKKKVRNIYSHPQVWGQVTNYLNSLQREIGSFEKIDSASTSEAVNICCHNYGNDNDSIDLAIASRTAAFVHKAAIVDCPINDKKGNTTRFLVLRRRAPTTTLIKARPPVDGSPQKISLLTFIVKQDDPGSLVDVLVVFKMHNINMCSISSRPYHELRNDTGNVRLNQQKENTSQRNWQYVFFVEFFHEDDRDWQKVFSEVSSRCMSYCVWGTFHRSGRYYE